MYLLFAACSKIQTRQQRKLSRLFANLQRYGLQYQRKFCSQVTKFKSFDLNLYWDVHRLLKFFHNFVWWCKLGPTLFDCQSIKQTLYFSSHPWRVYSIIRYDPHFSREIIRWHISIWQPTCVTSISKVWYFRINARARWTLRSKCTSYNPA